MCDGPPKPKGTQGSRHRITLLNALKNVVAEIQSASETESDDQKLILRVHQFGHTPLYTPVYSALNELVEFGQGLAVEFVSYEADSLVEAAVTKAQAWHPGGPPVLNLGLSEIASRHAVEDEKAFVEQFVEQPIIKRLPLWGIALENNASVIRLKDALSPEKDADLGSLHKLFSGKLSLVRPLDDRQHDCGLSLSIYTRGSTAYRVFDRFLSEHRQSSRQIRIEEVSFSREFDLLFEQCVDVALTVQPWRAVALAREHEVGIEIVYTHLGKPEPITSIYLAKDHSDNFSFWQAFLNVLGALIQENVRDLSEGRDDVYDTAYSQYEQTARTFDTQSIEPKPLFDCAIRVLTDSSVYVCDLPPGRNETPLSRRHANDLARRMVFFEAVRSRDLGYAASVAASLMRMNDWHEMDVPIERVNETATRQFRDVAQSMGQTFESTATPWDIRKSWCSRDTLKDLLGDFSRYKPNELSLPPELWRRRVNPQTLELAQEADEAAAQIDFSPWVPHMLLNKAAQHLKAQFEKEESGLKLEDVALDVFVFQKLSIMDESGAPRDQYEAICLVWIAYENQGLAAPKSNNFFGAESNIWGHLVFNGWFIDRAGEVRNVFRREGHGELVRRGEAYVLEGFTRDHTVRREKPQHEALLMTFKVAGVSH